MKTVFLTALLLAALPLRAEDRGLVAILPLDTNNAKLDAAARLSLEETIRTAAGDALVPQGYTVLTGETTMRILSDNGVDPLKACEATCALGAAKEMKATLFISGTVATSEGEHLAFVRLFSATNGKQLASLRLEGSSGKELRKMFDARAADFFAKGLAALGASPVSAPAMTPTPAIAPAAEVLLDLDLRKNLGPMKPGKNEVADCSQTADGLRCATRFQNGSFGWREALLSLNDHYEIEVTWKMLGTNTEGGPAFLFAHAGDRMAGCNASFFQSPGVVWCNNNDGKGWADTIGRREVASLKKDGRNTFGVRVVGRRVRAFVNGEQIGVYDSAIPLDGMINLATGGTTDLVFERVVIREAK